MEHFKDYGIFLGCGGKSAICWDCFIFVVVACGGRKGVNWVGGFYFSSGVCFGQWFRFYFLL